MASVLTQLHKAYIATFYEKRDTSAGYRLGLAKVGAFYAFAAVFQTSWLYVIASNWGIAQEFLHLSWYGWLFGLVWILMLWCVGHLLYIAARLVLVGRDSDAQVYQTLDQYKRMVRAIQLLSLGMLVDLLAMALYVSTGEGNVEPFVFLSGFMGARAVQANMEAIFAYHEV